MRQLPLLALFLCGHAQAATTPVRPTVSVPRLDTQIEVDGVLSEPVWEQAAVIENFHQYEPVDGRSAEERTVVRLFYSPSALHLGITAYDSVPDQIRATVADRDNIDADDSVTVYLDTFNDRRRAFFFAVNPLGIQQDGVRSEGTHSAGTVVGGNVDRNPDYLFDSRGRLTEEGYEIELRIPFKSLRYPGGNEPQRWRLNVLRKVQRTGYVDTWTDVRRGRASFLAQSGILEGLHDLHRGVTFEVQPFVTSLAEGQRNLADGLFKRRSPDLSGGLNLRVGVSSDTSLDATWNPDFSQVESDTGQVTVNERFALFFPERRPFFLEGIELFATPNQLIYTRRVVDPLAGGKITAKRGRLSLAHLTALDETNSADALFHTTRLRGDLGRDSTSGLTFTRRSQVDGYNTVLAGDARIVFNKIYFVQGQVGASWTKAGDETGSRRAPLWMAELDRTGHTWGFNYRLTGIGRSFEAQAGFVPRNDIVSGHVFNRLRYYGKRGALLETLNFLLGPTWVWEYDAFGSQKWIEQTLTTELIATLRGGWEVRTRIDRLDQDFDPGSFADYSVARAAGNVPYGAPDPLRGAWSVLGIVTTPVFRAVDGHLQVVTGTTPIFPEGSAGHETRVGLVARFRPRASLRIGTSLAYVRITRAQDGSEFARTVLPRLSIEYQPRRSMFFRLIAEYRAERTSPLRTADTGEPLLVGGTLSRGFEDNNLRLDALFSYEPTPGTVVFVGYGSTLQSPTGFTLANLSRRSDGLFVKLAYRFRR